MRAFASFSRRLAVPALALACIAPANAGTLGGPLSLEDEGVFFVNGKTSTSGHPGASLVTGPVVLQWLGENGARPD